MANTANRLFVTYVDAYNDLLKIWGQTNRTCATYIEKHLRQLTSEFDASPAPSPGSVRKGTFCFAKYDGDNYCRARIISDVIHNSVMVFYIDYGNKDRVDLSDVRIRNAAAESVVTKIVAQAEEFYLANIRSPQAGGWSSELLNEIRRGICFSEYNYGMVSDVAGERMIQINFHNEDYASVLIRQHLAKPVSLKEQIILLKNILKSQPNMDFTGNNYKYPNFGDTLAQQASKSNFNMPSKVFLKPMASDNLNPPMQAPGTSQPRQGRGVFAKNDRRFNNVNPPQNIAYNQSNNNAIYPEPKNEPVINSVVIEALANQLKQHLFKDSGTGASEAAAQGYITQVLDIGTTHNVYVTYVDDGPWSFSVQLVSNEHELNLLMADLASCKFQPIKLPLVLGSPCIAKSKRYDNYCRGVVVNISHSAVKIFFIDFGSIEDLPLNMLYEIPARFFKIKAMSQKFALSGLQQIKPTEEIKNSFVDVVENELLILHVTTLEGENLPTCDLYLRDVNVKKILNDRLRYVSNWIPVDLPQPGNTDNAVVTWIDSPQKFYVQLKSRSEELWKLKTELGNLGITGEYFRPDELYPGRICIAFFSGDSKWHRAVITAVNPTKSLTVFYVDYGNLEVVDPKMVKKVGNGLITQLSSQAIQCCLHGYENTPSDLSTTRALEELIFEKEVKLKVISNEGTHIVVKIFDNGTDISLKLNNLRPNPKAKSRLSGENGKTEINAARGDVYDARKDGKLRGISGAENTSNDSFRSLGKRNSRNEKSKNEHLSWRLHDDRQEFLPQKKEENRNNKLREFKKENSEMKNEKYDGGRVGRYYFNPKDNEAVGMSDRDQKDSGRNRRAKESLRGKIGGRDSKNLSRTTINLSERLKKAARENEARAHLAEDRITRYPLRLDNIAFNGETFKKKEVKVGSVEDVIVTYFMNPNEIYVQLVSSKDEFRSVMTEIQNYYATKLNLLTVPKKGDLVVAKFKLDGVLYRAVVTEADPITVRYIDFGNEEISEIECLWPMDKKFLELECQCLKCSLPDLKPVEGETWPAPSPEIDKIFKYEKYTCTFLKEQDSGYEVNLIICSNGKHVRDELISSGFALPVASTIDSHLEKEKGPMAFDLMKNECYSVFISHIVSPSKFYVQIRSSAVETIEQDLKKYIVGEQFGWPLDINSANIGRMCIVKMESGSWRRAKLIEKRETGAIVRLIDYGNELSVKNEEVRGMPDNFVGYPPQAAECSLLIDPDKLTAEVNDRFAECNEKYFAAFVHDITDETLKVTLYNFTGEKLKFLDCVKDAPPHIRPITYLPIIQREMHVVPSYINSAKEIYIQLKDDMPSLEKLSEFMKNYYSNLGDNLEVKLNLAENEFCAAKSATSDRWYRAQILSISGESAKILFIDFGNTEEVPLENLKKLDSSLYERNAYAKKVSLDIDYDDDSEESINSKLKKLIEGKECIGYFVKTNNVLYAEFVVDNAPITPQLICGSAKELAEGIFRNYIPKKSHSESTKVFISHVSNPGDFWVHEENIISELSMFQDKLKAACSNKSNVITGERIEPGDIIGNVFKDGLWYRALATDVKDNIISIRFIDYGNTYDVDKTESKFALLSNELKQPAPFARRCSLKGRWKESATSRFEEIVMKHEDTFNLIMKGENNEVDLLQNESSITEQLIYEGYQMMENGSIVYITHINSPDDFYIQNGSDSDMFDKIITDLSEASSFEDADLNLNDLYCAKFPEDNSWYRAKIVKKDSEGITVKFIDYGNCSSVTDIKKLPTHLQTLRPLSVNCCFVNEKSSDTWSKTACTLFSEYMNTVPLKIEVVRQEEQIHFIRLFTEDGKDLGEILAGLCQNDNTSRDEGVRNNDTDPPQSESSLHEETAGNTDASDRNEIKIDENDVVKTESEDTNNLETSPLTEQGPKLSTCYGNKIVPGWVGQGKAILEDEGTPECFQELLHSENKVSGCITKGLSLEEVSTPDTKEVKEIKCTSLSAPGTPSACRRPRQIYQKVEYEDKLLPGCISNGNLLVPTQDKTAHDDKQVAGNVNGTVKATED